MAAGFARSRDYLTTHQPAPDGARRRARLVTFGRYGVAIAPDGTRRATVGDGGTVRIWDAATWQQRAALTGHDGWVNAVAIAPDGTWLATVGEDRTLHVWDPATGRCRAVMRVESELRNCEWSPSGKSVAAVGAVGWYYFAFRP